MISIFIFFATGRNELETILKPSNLTDVYQFGVYKGVSMKLLDNILKPNTLWGFDSFKGLPETKEKNIRTWRVNAFKADPRNELKKDYKNFQFVSGYFNVSLTDEIASQMRPANYIDIDVDLFESSITALGFMFRNKLAVPGTYIGYDDIWVQPCSNNVHPLDVAEGKAHKLISDTFHVEFECMNRACQRNPSGWGPVFRIKTIGKKIDYGWHVLPNEKVPKCNGRGDKFITHFG